MSGPDDYPVEMREPRILDQETIEAQPTGRAVLGDDGLLAEVARSARAFTQQPAPLPGASSPGCE